MLNAKTVGVIKGRFQTYEPHKGHCYTIHEVRKRHQDVLIILGTTYDSTDRDPLPFVLRKMMLEGMFPGVTIIEDPSSPRSYKNRSRELDELIESSYPGRDAVIYGARDSIVHTYRGKFRVALTRTVFAGSATEMRENIPYLNSTDFRKGYIRGVVDRKPVFYPAIDVAVVHGNTGDVLMIGLTEEGRKLRFPGVFFNPEVDDSYEDAAMRCVAKEVPGIGVGSPIIIGSTKIDDWRYRKTRNGVVTLLTKASWNGGEPRPGKGIARVKWVEWENVPRVVSKTHRPLALMEPWYK